MYGEVPRYGSQQGRDTSVQQPSSSAYQPEPSPSSYQQEPYQQEPYQQQPYQQQPYQQPYPGQVPTGPFLAPANAYLQPAAQLQPYVPSYPYAVWIRRVGAYLIDFAPNLVAQVVFSIGYGIWLTQLAGQSSTGSPALPTGGLVWMAVGTALLLAAVGWQIYNRWIVAGRTGQSMGKRVLQLSLVAEPTGQPIGALNAFLRDLLHILDGFAYVGFLWPLWDRKRQTFSDMLMKTLVVDLRALDRRQ